MTPTPKPQPTITVIVPVHNSAEHLDRCLAGLRNSTFKNFECIAVDDASTDDSAEVAEQHGCKVIRGRINRGPAAARNRAIGEASGEILYFVDADVCVSPDSLARVAECFEQEADLDAVIGSYDDEPDEPDFLSQYRNLFHHFVHQEANEEAFTFWSGCGAIRRSVLVNYAGFSEEYKRPSVEDIELGYRMHADARRMRLDKQLRVKHLKKWSFWSILKTDVLDRGIPWTELILSSRRMHSDLNLRVMQRVNVALVHLLVLAVLAIVIQFGGLIVAPLAAGLYLVVANYWLFNWTSTSLRPRRAIELIGGLAAAVLVAVGYGLPSLLPPLLLGTAILILQHRFLRPREESGLAKVLSAVTGVASLCCGVYLLGHWPRDLMILPPILLLAVVMTLNVRFYAFLAHTHDALFACTAIPFHLLYYFYCGVSFVAGTVLHWSKKGALKRKSVRHPAATIE